MNQPSSHDVELLSAYLDGQLSQADSARLESRIQLDPQLRSVYDDLRQSQALLRKLPARRAPRNFRLTPKMAGIKPPLPRAFPVFRLASVLAAILFFISYAVNLSVPAASNRNSAVFPSAAGGGPAAMELAPAAATGSQADTFAPKSAPTQEAQATSLPAQDTLAPTATPETMSFTIAPTPTELGQAKGTTPPNERRPFYSPVASKPLTLPVHPVWLLSLLGLTVISGVTAFLVRARTERNWSKANALEPAGLGTKDVVLIAVATVAVLLLVAGIYWMSTTTF